MAGRRIILTARDGPEPEHARSWWGGLGCYLKMAFRSLRLGIKARSRHPKRSSLWPCNNNNTTASLQHHGGYQRQSGPSSTLILNPMGILPLLLLLPLPLLLLLLLLLIIIIIIIPLFLTGRNSSGTSSA
jgi:hypothetical protein